MGKHSSIDGAKVVAQPFIWPDIQTERAISSDLRACLPDKASDFEIPFADRTLKMRGPVVGCSNTFLFCTTLNVDGEELLLWGHDDLLAAALEAFEHNAVVADYPADATPLVLEHLTQPLVQAFAQGLGATQITVVTHRRSNDVPIGDTIAIEFEGNAGKIQRLLIAGSTPLLVRIAGLFGDPPGKRKQLPLGDIPFSCALMGQDFEAVVSDIIALQPEDVLVLDAAWLDPEAFVFRVADKFSARMARDGARLRILTNFHPLKRTPDMPALNRSLDELPVTVSIELARKNVVLSDLDTLSVGDVMSFGGEELSEVKLTANGAPLGSGVLVKVNELTEAFKIGFLLYLPFVAIDLAITTILMALGMQMVQPNIISVPFKLLTFVFVDGWARLIEGLVLTYQV